MSDEVFFYLPSSVLQRNVTLNTGKIFPKITLGVSKIKSFETLSKVLDTGLKVGYRSIDCSTAYGTENFVGEALERLLPQYNLQRSDIQLTTKIHPRDYGTETTSEAFWRSCENLRTDYIDLFMMHWPGGMNLHPDDEENVRLREETWKEMLELTSKGVVKNPGVCHFSCKQIEGLYSCSNKFPAVIQAEFHPHCPQIDVLDFCKESNIHPQACSFEESFHPLVLHNEVVRKVAKDVGRTPTQVLLKWLINKEVGVIPHSENPRKVTQNFELFDFVLDKPQMDMINSIETRQKYLRNPIIIF